MVSSGLDQLLDRCAAAERAIFPVPIHRNSETVLTQISVMTV